MTEAPLSSTDPMLAAAAVSAKFEEAETKFPDAPTLESDLVKLPGGLVRGENVYRTAQVRELTGEHEEKIYRALLSQNPAHIRSVILECGLVRIGDLNESESRKLLPSLLIGDRDAIVLGIRNMTYDDSVDVSEWKCPECMEPMDLHLDLYEDIEVKKLTDPAKEVTFDVALRKGGKAVVKLPTGADQLVVGESTDRTGAERNSILLQQCVIEVDKPDGKGGEAKIMIAAMPGYVKSLGMKDRRTILEEIVKRQPGPQYQDIKITHDSCGKEVSLALDLVDLFLI